MRTVCAAVPRHDVCGEEGRVMQWQPCTGVVPRRGRHSDEIAMADVEGMVMGGAERTVDSRCAIEQRRERKNGGGEEWAGTVLGGKPERNGPCGENG
jgi:hypothetical protein